MPLTTFRFAQSRTSAKATILGLLFFWTVLPWHAEAQTLASKYRGVGVVHVRLNPPDNSGQPSIDVEIVNGSHITVAAYGIRVFTQYANGNESSSQTVMDLSPVIALRKTFPQQKFPSLSSLLPRQHTVFHTTAGQDPSGSPAVSARAVITSVLFADGTQEGDMSELQTFFSEWAGEAAEAVRWLPRLVALRNCTSNTVSQAASNLSAQISAAASDPARISLYALIARGDVKYHLDSIAATGQAIHSNQANYSSASGQPPATSLDLSINKRIDLFQWRTNFLLQTLGGAGIGTSTNPIAPVATPALANISQTSATVGDAPFTLTLTGSNFWNGPGGTTAQVNGVPRATTFVSATQLTIPITSTDLGTAQILQIAVLDPTTCYGPGAALGLAVNSSSSGSGTNPIPTITSLSPTSTTAGGTGSTLTVNGTNFVKPSAVQVNGSSRATAFVSATQLTAAITAGDLATLGTLSISVANPAPGGGSSGTVSLPVNAPLPVVYGLLPNSATVGGAAFTLAVNGSNFLNTSVVLVGGNNHATTFVNNMQLTASIPASDIASAGTLPVTVVNPTPAGVTSSAPVTFTVNNPLPGVTGLSPNSANAGGPAFTLTVNGTNFISGATVLFNGNSRTTTLVSTNAGPQLTASIPASDIATGGRFSITVANPSPTGGVAPASFTVYNPVPAVSSLSPASTTVGSAFTLTVNGTNFVSTSVVQVNGSSRTTTFVNSTQLTASIPASDVATTGALSITVVNPTPGGGTSAAQSVNVNNPIPTVSSLSPNSATAGGAAFTLTVNGTNFVSGATVQVNGSGRTTTFVSGTQLMASILASDVASAGTLSITVVNPAPSSGPSTAATFTVNNLSPTITSLSPSIATAGGAAFTLTVNGTNFVSGATVKVNGTSRTTTFVSATQLTASIPATDIATAGTLSITVVNPAPSSGPSTAATFTVNNSVPTISSVSPSSATAGGSAFTLTVNGTNFVNGATVKVNGSSRTTTFVSTNAGPQLTASIPASDIASAGTLSITVVNPAPSSGASAAATFTVNNPAPTISSLSPNSATAGGAAFTLTVNGTSFVGGATVKVNGFSRTTTFVSATQLTASISASDIASAGTLSITVVNPTPGGGASSAASFTVNSAAPAISGLSPQSVAVAGPDFTLTISGSNFVSGAMVQISDLNGTLSGTRSATFISSTQLKVQMFAGDIASADTIYFWVVNPNNTTSNPAMMNVQ